MDKNVLRNLSYGVYVIGAMDNSRPVGCVANCAVQLTYDTMALSLNHNNYTNKIIKETGKFSLSILSEKVDPNIIAMFGFTSSKEKNKFENFEYKVVDETPVLLNSTGYITGEIVNAVELETHTLFIAKMREGEILEKETPMTYKFYHEVLKGNAPKAAPTYVESQVKKDGGKKFKCKICGYIYDGDISKEAPNYVCPVCKQPKSVFEEIAYA